MIQAKKYRKASALILVFALLAAVLCNLSACVPQGTQVPTPSQTEPTEIKTTLTVSNVRAKAGDQGVEVIIDVTNNPGILGMDFDLYYDDSVMTLVDAQSLLELEGGVYTPPAYYRNPTTFLWDFQDINWVDDGVFLKLYFDIQEDAHVGDYQLKLMYSYGNIFDGNCEPIDVSVKHGKLSIY